MSLRDDQTSAPLLLYNSLTRQLEPFVPVHADEARVYSCGPTVYNYQHIGNMRAYVFADTLGRTLSFKGDRKRVVSGKRVPVRVDFGVRRNIKKKKHETSSYFVIKYIKYKR